ncbi:transglutaminase-like domain-containing protein [Chitinophaga sp.]|uniref:transglutaminase-like domain-containing protein n=1 Tax=Chitinophaga sp. TaxID=1869181 RepID=UPI0031DF48B3
MNIRSYTVLLLLLLQSAYAKAQDDPDNIELASSSETFEFQYNAKQKQVTVKQLIHKDFVCNSFRATIPFSEPYNNQEEITDLTILTDGKKNRTISPTYDYLNIDEYFYSDQKICYFNLPFSKQGAHNEVNIEKAIHDPRYLTTVYLTDYYPSKLKTITIIVPRWMNIDIHTFHFENQKIKTEKSYDKDRDADVYTYTATNLAAMKKSTMSPGPSWIYPHILVRSKSADYKGEKTVYFNTTNDLYQWCHNLASQLHPDTAVLGAKAREITAGIPDKFDQLKAVFYWVEENIRYIAFEDGLAGFRPDEAHEVMRKKYGDCKGMANLTKELLLRCGLDARLCWIGTNHIMYDHSIPSLNADNHMICAVQYNNKWWFLDATEKYMQPGIYAERIAGRQVMIENGDNCLLENIPVTTPAQNARLFREALAIEGNNMTGKIQYKYNGESKSDLLYNINLTKKDRVQTALETYITNKNSHYKISNVTTTRLDQRDGDLEVSFDLLYPDAVSSFGKEMYIDIDYNKEYNNAVIDTVKRKTDIRFDSKNNYITETELLIPAGYKMTFLPEDLHISTPNFIFDITYKATGNKITYRKQLQINNTYLQKAAFGDWNKAVVALSKKYLEQITLTQQ